METLSGWSNFFKTVLSPSQKEINFKGEQLAPNISQLFSFLSRFLFRSGLDCRKSNKKSQKLSVSLTLWKHAYSNILKILQPNKENFQIKISDIFYISAQNIDCGYSQSMFLSRNMKNNVYPCKPQFYYIKGGLKGVNILSWRLIMKYFLRSFSPFCWFKKGSCQFLAKECAQYWLTA